MFIELSSSLLDFFKILVYVEMEFWVFIHTKVYVMETSHNLIILSI